MTQVLTVADMRDSDASTIKNGTASTELMYRAGAAIFEKIKTYAAPFAIVCGSGNNAGDGYVIALLCKEANIPCHIFLCKEKFSEDGLYYYNQCVEKNIAYSIIEDSFTLSEYPTVIDCIFGTGFHSEVTGKYAEILQKINNSNSYVISVDINSGLNGDSGISNLCVHSDETLSIGNYQPGHFLAMAKDVMKEKSNFDIGIMPNNNVVDITLLDNDIVNIAFADRANFSNKGTYGYIALIGGSSCYSGAIRLANMAAAAMRSGAGVVKLAAPASLMNTITPALLESTYYPLSDDNGELIFCKEEFDKLIMGISTIAFGMGIGNTAETKAALIYLLEHFEGTLIIDADGLNVLATMDISIYKNTRAKLILTPHPKEFSRLTGYDTKEILADPVKYANEYAKKTNTIVLLKGTATVITDGNKTYINDKGCPGMATAGSGDVLSGIVSAVCASNKDNLLLATAASSYVAGLAGELAATEIGNISMIASDTVKYLPKAIISIKH